MLVRIVGIKRYTDRTGKARAYWRRKGAPAITIDPALTGAALAAEIARLEKKYLAPLAKAGTLRSLIILYKQQSNHWRLLRKRTRSDYEEVFTWLGDAMDTPLIDIDAVQIAATRDKARDQRTVKFANQVMTTLKMVFRFGIGAGEVTANPCEGLEPATRDVSADDELQQQAAPIANRALTPAEAVAVLDNAPMKLRPAIALALYCCLREGDAIAVLKSAPAGEWMTTLQGKSRRMGKPPKPVLTYLVPDLQAILRRIPANDAVTLCVKADGRPWTLEGFKTAWSRYRDELLKAGKIGPGVTYHGLRHTGPTFLEDAGYDEMQTKHLLGHGPRTVSGIYGASAERRKLLRDMALVVEQVIREARGNVVRIGTESV